MPNLSYAAAALSLMLGALATTTAAAADAPAADASQPAASVSALPPALGEYHEGGVHVTLHLVREDAGDQLVARFTPTAVGDGWHLYGSDLPEAGIEIFPGTFLGRPTMIRLAEGSSASLSGTMTANPPMAMAFNVGMQREINEFPSGVVDLHYPIELPAEASDTTVHIWYMLCRASACMRPADGVPVTINLPAR